MTISRRALIAGTGLLLPGLCEAADAPLAALEKQSGARVGVAALDTGSGKRIAWRAEERFVMCSTFKLSLAAAILAKADRGREALARPIPIGPDVPLGASPATRKNVGKDMTIAQLCEAAVIFSDNGAANTLLKALGGPQALTAYWRSIGDRITRLDDFEPKLNIPDGERSTTTPNAMLGNLKALLLGDVLSPASRNRLLAWMRASTTGASRLHAGLPADWKWGDKTGTSAEQYGLINDIGIATPPGRNPILMVAYTAHGDEKTVAAIGGILAKAFA
jgi:beta-lactamase class A